MIKASPEIAEQVRKNKKPVQIYSFFPIDPRENTEAHHHLIQWRRKFEMMNEKARRQMMEDMGVLESPTDKTNKKRYEITCDNCKEVLGYVWAADDKLRNWCDLHYSQWSDGKQWFGCLSPHVSPIDGSLCFQCCCGQDTRDFRANMTLDANEADRIEQKNKEGRTWGHKNSKFKLRQVSATLKPYG